MQPIKQFQQTIEIQHYSKETFKSYQFHIDKFRRYYGDNITIENILRHLHYLTNKGFSASTVNITRAALLYYANMILHKDIMSENIITIRRTKPLPKPIDANIIKTMIDNTSNLKHRIVLEILYGSGLR